MDDWQWDDTLFKGSAAYYRRGRLPYAPGLVDALTEVLDLDGTGRLLDVGCGPGTLALSLARSFREVVGVDPDAGMLAEAETEARAADASVSERTRWVQARAEELPDDLGTFTVVTFGQSFHWMDRDLVARRVRDLLAPGGVFVHVADLKTEAPSGDGPPRPAPPYAAVDDLVARYLGPVRRAGRGVLPHGTPGGEDEVLARAGYSGPTRLVVPGGRVLERDVDDLVAWVYSRSSSTPHLFGRRRADFEADLCRLLAETAPDGRYAERQPSTEVRIWRPPRRTPG